MEHINTPQEFVKEIEEILLTIYVIVKV